LYAPNDTLASPLVPNDPLFGTAYRSLGLLGRGGMGEVFAEELARIAGGLSPEPRVRSRSAEAGLFVTLTLASAMVFSAVFMLVWRRWEGRR
jgi:hypothetical protein